MTKPRKKALIIDDERGVRLMLEEALSETHECSLVCNGLEGFELACKHWLYDIVIMDLSMPDWDGMDALGMIQTLNPESKIIVATAHLSSEAKKDLAALPCVRRILEKPVSVESFLQIVTEVEAMDVVVGQCG